MLPSAEVLAMELGKASVPHLGAFLANVGRQRFDKFVAMSTSIFQDHLETTERKCSHIKNILYRDTPVELFSQYVNNEFISNGERISDNFIKKSISAEGARYLVTGGAGSGKSMFMKWLSLNLCRDILHHQKIPIFLEMRSLPVSVVSMKIEDLVFKSAASSKSRATIEQFRAGLMYGAFIIVLDGLDEISPRYRDEFLRNIADFGRLFPAVSLICSTRPDRGIESLSELTILRVLDMSVDQVSDLIGRATFDEEKKKSFVTELRSGLFEEHKSFLSNPLLAIIMLITFDVSSSVPKKLSLFYSYAYEALFYKHDSSKGVYIREHFTTLGIDEFERVFRAFSFVTFSLGKFRFDLSELTSLMRESLDACGLREVRPEDYILDCQQSLCLLQEDGLEYIFVHRSFQEYFSARYLLFFVGTDYYDFVNGLADRFHTDSVIDMLYEMDPDSCQRRWILPRLEMEVSDLWYIEKTDYTNLAKFLRTYANAITVDMQNGIIKYHTWSSGDRAGTYILISKILQGEFGFKDMLLSGRVGGESFSLDALLRKAKSGLNKEVYDEMNSSISINNDNDAQILFSESLCNWMSVTDLPSLLRELGARLIEVRNELTKKLAKRDEFTAKVSSILRRGH